jgi:hypothetical protein
MKKKRPGVDFFAKGDFAGLTNLHTSNQEHQTETWEISEQWSRGPSLSAHDLRGCLGIQTQYRYRSYYYRY